MIKGILLIGLAAIVLVVMVAAGFTLKTMFFFLVFLVLGFLFLPEATTLIVIGLIVMMLLL